MGIPVGESLAFGKPCLASNAGSIPEVGGDLAVYFNPHDLIGATALLEKAIFDESFLGGLAARIEAEFTPRRWADVTENFLKRVGDCMEVIRNGDGARIQSRPIKIPINRASFYKLTGDALLERSRTSWPHQLMRLVRYSGWHPLEPWGSWSSKRRAQLRLNLGAEHAGQEASLYLELRLPPYDADQQVWVSNSVGNSVALTSLGAPRWVRCKVAVDDDGFINIYIERHLRETEVGNGDARRLYVDCRFGLLPEQRFGR